MKHSFLLLFLILTSWISQAQTGTTVLRLVGDTAYAYDHSVNAPARSKSELFNRAKRFLRTELDASDNTFNADSLSFDSLQSIGFLKLPNVEGLTNIVVDFSASFKPTDGTLRFDASNFNLHAFGANGDSYDPTLEDLNDFTEPQRTAIYRAFDSRWTDLIARLDRLGR